MQALPDSLFPCFEEQLPVHHKLEELLDQYLEITGLKKEPESLLFPAAIGKTGKLSRRRLVRTDAADMLKRRLKQAGLPAHYSPHSFRATGITNFLENDGTLEAAQRIAGHADSRTTKLYDRRGQKVLLEDIWIGFGIERQKRSSMKPRDQAPCEDVYGARRPVMNISSIDESQAAHRWFLSFQ
jgi:hypothetical protein